MKILLVLNKQGREIVENARRILLSILPKDIEIEYLTIDAPIMSFTNPEIIRRMVLNYLHKVEKKPDLIILPYNFRKIKHRVLRLENVPIIEGPKNIVDVVAVVLYLNDRSLEELLKNLESYEIDRVVRDYKCVIENYVLSNLSNLAKYRLKISSRLTVTDVIPLIDAEIIDATLRSVEECVNIARYYVDSGADIIDIGCVAGDPKPWRIREIVRGIRREIGDIPISIDTFSENEIKEGLKADVDIVLSYTLSKLKASDIKFNDIGVVIVPETFNNLVSYFEESCKLVEKKGGVPIVDPLIAPPLFGLSHSIERIVRLREAFPDRPMLVGVGNVTELIDVDSVGVNGVLAVIAVEQKVNILLTTEASMKCRGAVRELKIALEMCALAKVLHKYPKDMCRSLLLAKRKW